ncbi:hypothetical protein [Arcobacter porcinus]|uniref:Putative cytochrome c oxidase-associated protein CcoH n=1 Tax=Arcobacter porcinus TaxID=1935204 RepID=A0A5C2HHW1_9BACT|nr:hypothetical protein [Arcobacter porcinus]OCL97101.1 FixH [Aliarcobacter thereius]QEP39898.1 putative cytochrome c oxidase-associated protein CcoH [Arcobacter porcinus]
MKKRNYWPLFFIAIFGFTVYMIIWTITQALNSPVIEDRSFMQKYQYVDENYNEIMNANLDFLEKYKLELNLNGKIFPLTTEDIKFGQRVIEKYSQHKDNLNIGENSINLTVIDMNSNKSTPISFDILITKTMTNENDIELNSKNFEEDNGIYSSKFNINEKTNWIITGKIKTEDKEGYIFIKTNAR